MGVAPTIEGYDQSLVARLYIAIKRNFVLLVGGGALLERDVGEARFFISRNLFFILFAAVFLVFQGIRNYGCNVYNGRNINLG